MDAWLQQLCDVDLVEAWMEQLDEISSMDTMDKYATNLGCRAYAGYRQGGGQYDAYCHSTGRICFFFQNVSGMKKQCRKHGLDEIDSGLHDFVRLR